jgi:hypothetical protein
LAGGAGLLHQPQNHLPVQQRVDGLLFGLPQKVIPPPAPATDYLGPQLLVQPILQTPALPAGGFA